MVSPSQLKPYVTRTNPDGVEVVTGPEGSSNNVPVADYGTLYRPDPRTITEHLGIDSIHRTAEDPSPTANGLPSQGYVPPSNHFGDNLLVDDPSLSDNKRTLDAIANADGNRIHDPVTHTADETDYDPEEAAGDVIPERDKPSDGGSTEPPVTEPEEPPVDETEPETPPEEDAGYQPPEALR